MEQIEQDIVPRIDKDIKRQCQESCKAVKDELKALIKEDSKNKEKKIVTLEGRVEDIKHAQEQLLDELNRHQENYQSIMEQYASDY